MSLLYPLLGSQTVVWKPEEGVEQVVYVNILPHYTINRERCHFKMNFKIGGASVKSKT
jgi:hypothetical protein